MSALLELSQKDKARWFGDGPAVLPTAVHNDYEEVDVHAKYAAFGESAGIRYIQDSIGYIRVQSLIATEEVSGRDMLRWLNAAYRRLVWVDEVVESSFGFWDKMQQQGLVSYWDTGVFTGKSVPAYPWAPKA